MTIWTSPKLIRSNLLRPKIGFGEQWSLSAEASTTADLRAVVQVLVGLAIERKDSGPAGLRVSVSPRFDGPGDRIRMGNGPWHLPRREDLERIAALEWLARVGLSLQAFPVPNWLAWQWLVDRQLLTIGQARGMAGLGDPG